MKKIALTSLLAVFTVSAANAATNYFVGGNAALRTDNDHATTALNVAPEFGWKVDSKWDLGVMANFGYDHKGFQNIRDDAGIMTSMGVKTYSYGAGAFARYNVAEFGGVKLLLKGTVRAGFDTYYHKKENAADKSYTETASSINASIVPMITYDVSEAFTLYANLNFLQVDAGYNFKNKDLDRNKSWNVIAGANSDNVANTGAFQIGFNYNF